MTCVDQVCADSLATRVQYGEDMKLKKATNDGKPRRQQRVILQWQISWPRRAIVT